MSKVKVRSQQYFTYLWQSKVTPPLTNFVIYPLCFTAYTYCDVTSQLFSLKGGGASNPKTQTLTTWSVSSSYDFNGFLLNFSGPGISTIWPIARLYSTWRSSNPWFGKKISTKFLQTFNFCSRCRRWPFDMQQLLDRPPNRWFIQHEITMHAVHFILPLPSSLVVALFSFFLSSSACTHCRPSGL